MDDGKRCEIMRRLSRADRRRNTEIFARCDSGCARMRVASGDLFVPRAFNTTRRNEKFLRPRSRRAARTRKRDPASRKSPRAHRLDAEFPGSLQPDQRQSDGIFDKAIFWFVHSVARAEATPATAGVWSSDCGIARPLSIGKLIIPHHREPAGRKPRNFRARWLRAGEQHPLDDATPPSPSRFILSIRTKRAT